MCQQNKQFLEREGINTSSWLESGSQADKTLNYSTETSVSAFGCLQSFEQVTFVPISHVTAGLLCGLECR